VVGRQECARMCQGANMRGRQECVLECTKEQNALSDFMCIVANMRGRQECARMCQQKT
jgi:hypothetical protein